MGLVYQIEVHAMRTNGLKIVSSDQGGSGLLDATVAGLSEGQFCLFYESGQSPMSAQVGGFAGFEAQKLAYKMVEVNRKSQAQSMRATQKSQWGF